eukprot:gene1648-16115_t
MAATLFKQTANSSPVLTRRFCENVARRLEIGNFNKIIRFGRPRLAYNILPAKETFSKSQPVVILHGMFGSKRNWNSLARVLNQRTGRSVITFDARNHGDSEHHISMSYEAMAHDTLGLLEKLDLKQCVLIGHSMGGKTVMSIALQNPQIVDKLIVVDSAPRTSIAATSAVSCLKAMMKLDLNLIHSRADADQALKPEIKDDEVRRFILTNLEDSSYGMKWIINLQFFHKNIKDLLEFPAFGEQQYLGQTLFLAGQKSDYITDAEIPDIHRLFPTAEIEYINDAGHWVHSDQPKIFLDSVVKFLGT